MSENSIVKNMLMWQPSAVVHVLAFLMPDIFFAMSEQMVICV